MILTTNMTSKYTKLVYADFTVSHHHMNTPVSKIHTFSNSSGILSALCLYQVFNLLSMLSNEKYSGTNY